MKRKKYDLSTPSGRAMQLLDDPKWPWNKFPRRQMNMVASFSQRRLGIDAYHLARSIRRFFTGTYSKTIPPRYWPR